MAEEFVWSQKYLIYKKEEDFPEEDKKLIEAAKEATQMAYAPYSGFRVGAALLLEDGSIITGANQENAAYPECSCAEKVAFFKAATTGTKQKVVKAAVVAEKDGEWVAATPCGGCRQVMLETEAVQGENIVLIMMADADQWVKTQSIKSLLPFSFRL
jgi:cytidine deaminase